MFRKPQEAVGVTRLRWDLMTAVARTTGFVCAALTWLLCLSASLAWAQDAVPSQYARDFRMAGDASRTRVVVEFDREPELHWFLLGSPSRLVFDLANTRLAFSPEQLKARGMIAEVRYGASAGDASRIVLTAKGPFSVDRVDILKNEASAGFRVVVDLLAVSERQFRQALADQSQTTGSLRPGASATDAAKGFQPSESGRFRIVLDAGHGGFDGGAEGVSGTIEKDVTLAFARELRDRLAAAGPYQVFMTRDADTFLPLDERVAIARRDEAKLMISIHADTINVPELHGATVYTMSDKASDPVAEATAVRENLSDELAGIESQDDNQQVADVLVDLIRRETHGLSARFARSLVDEFAPSIGMIKNPHRAAGFRVLRAPDVPSVLIELGYLSNAKDEAKLVDPAWRSRAIDGIVAAINAFAGGRTSAAR